MDALAVIAVIGGIALLIGIFGGGFKAKEVEIPLIPVPVRILSSIIGTVLIATTIWLSSQDNGQGFIPPPVTTTSTAPTATSCSVKESVTIPFTGGPFAVQTQYAYVGTVLVTITGTGQAGGTDIIDAFYMFADAAGNRIDIQPADEWGFAINGEFAERYLEFQKLPAYRDDHIYNFSINAPGGNLSLGVVDEYVLDNTGYYSVVLCN